MRSKLGSLAAAAVFGLAVASGWAGTARAAVATYNFDAQAVGTSTPFSITDNGVTASFSSSVDPGGFQIAPSFLVTLTGIY